MMNDEVKLQRRKAIGEQIAAIREKKGYGVRSLAEKCGVNYTNICKIERGAYNVSIDILSKICDALECDIIINERND